MRLLETATNTVQNALFSRGSHEVPQHLTAIVAIRETSLQAANIWFGRGSADTMKNRYAAAAEKVTKYLTPDVLKNPAFYSLNTPAGHTRTIQLLSSSVPDRYENAEVYAEFLKSERHKILTSYLRELVARQIPLQLLSDSNEIGKGDYSKRMKDFLRRTESVPGYYLEAISASTGLPKIPEVIRRSTTSSLPSQQEDRKEVRVITTSRTTFHRDNGQGPIIDQFGNSRLFCRFSNKKEFLLLFLFLRSILEGIMNAVKLLREQLQSAHYVQEATLEGVTEDVAHFNEIGKAIPVGAAYAHSVLAEDMIVAGMLTKTKPLATPDAKTGVSAPMPSQEEWDKHEEWYKTVKVDLPVLREFAKKVYKATDDYLATLKDEDLDKEMDVPGMGKQNLGWLIGNFVILHIAQLTGEMSSVKGVQGLKGYPF